MGGNGFVLGGGGWWVGLFWVVVGSGRFILGGGWWWVYFWW